MSQLSTLSQLSGFSDIISDVDGFIDENNISNDVKTVLGGLPNGNSHLLHEVDDEDYKAATQDFFNAPDYPENNYPPEQPSDLCNEEYAGPCDFEVFVIPNGQKTPWEYSLKLNKIFIGINLRFPVGFSVKRRPLNSPLYVRVTPVFSQTQHLQDLVHRCVVHLHPGDPLNKGLPEHILEHIIRSSNERALYFGSKDKKTRHSIVVPLDEPQAGTDVVREFFQFVCKNSCCPLGINRRPIEIIFSLENQDGDIIGRRVVSVRICCCPKRDKEKEERDMDKKRNVISQGKKRKLEKEDGKKMAPLDDSLPDTRLYPMNINIVGKENQIRVLKFCRDLMAGEILKLEEGNGADAPFRKCFNDLDALISKATSE